jgi:hypothetical protein
MVFVSLWLSSLAVSAHHSFQATFDTNATITIEGTLVAFMLRNPHSLVHVMAPDEAGVMQRWSVAWGGSNQLFQQGLNQKSFKAGDHVVITGNPGRNPENHMVRMLTILRPADGFGWGNRAGENFQ